MVHKKIEEKTRAQIAEILPNAIETAMLSYQLFLDKENNTNSSKEFKAHHDACKVAIAHVALLIKLARWADLPDQSIADAEQQKILQDMMKNAENEVADYNDRHDDVSE